MNENEIWCDACDTKLTTIKCLRMELDLRDELITRLKEENRLVCEHREILTAKLDEKFLGIS